MTRLRALAALALFCLATVAAVGSETAATVPLAVPRVVALAATLGGAFPLSVRLDATASRGAAGPVAAFRWSLAREADGSALVPVGSRVAGVDQPSSATPVLTLDLPGTFTLELSVYDGVAWSEPARLALLAVEAEPAGPAIAAAGAAKQGPRPALRGERVAVYATSGGDPVAALDDFVQIYEGTRPLSPAPVPLTAERTARLVGVTLSATTTDGTVLTLERVREDGQFYFPHEVLRTYTVRLSNNSSMQLVLGDPGTVFVNRALLGQTIDITVNLGNQVPAIVGGTGSRGCALGDGSGSGALDLAALALVLAALPFSAGRRSGPGPDRRPTATRPRRRE